MERVGCLQFFRVTANGTSGNLSCRTKSMKQKMSGVTTQVLGSCQWTLDSHLHHGQVQGHQDVHHSAWTPWALSFGWLQWIKESMGNIRSVIQMGFWTAINTILHVLNGITQPLSGKMANSWRILELFGTDEHPRIPFCPMWFPIESHNLTGEKLP